MAMDGLPGWARDALKAKVGDEVVTKAEVVRDGALRKLAVALTPTRTVVAEKGILGVTTYEISAALPAGAAAAGASAGAMPAPAAKAAPRKAREAPKGAKPRAARGEVQPRRAPAKGKGAGKAAAKAPKGKAGAVPAPTTPDQAIEAIEGIGDTYGPRLRAAGVAKVEDLLASQPDGLAQRAEVPVALITKWQAMARLQAVRGIGPQYSELLVRAGVTTLEQLAEASPGGLARQLNDYQEQLGANVQGNVISDAMVDAWVSGAQDALERGAKGSA